MLNAERHKYRSGFNVWRFGCLQTLYQASDYRASPYSLTVKLKFPLCLTKYDAMKTYPVLK